MSATKAIFQNIQYDSYEFFAEFVFSCSIYSVHKEHPIPFRASRARSDHKNCQFDFLY